jgi:hypothetical protein
MVRVTEKTVVARMRDGKRVEAHSVYLKSGRTVEAPFTEPVGESIPVQAAAKKIAILAEPFRPGIQEAPCRCLKLLRPAPERFGSCCRSS